MPAFSGLDPRLRERAEKTVEYAGKLGVRVEVTSVRRNDAEQTRLYKLYQQGKWPWPVAAPGTSAHQYGVAWDSTVRPEHMALWIAIRRAMGWTVPANDEIHAEWPRWQDYRSLLSRS